MIDVSALRQQLVRTFPTVVISSVLGLGVILGTYGVSRITGTSLSNLTRDPTALIEGAPFYFGAMSTLGLLVWAAATGICLFGAASLSRDERTHRSSRFLLWSGLLSLMLTLDDALLFHERLFPYYLHVPEEIVYAGYALFFVGYLIYFFPEMLRSDYLLLLLAVSFLGGSMVIDEVLSSSERRRFAEDGLKFLGIVFWLAFFAHATHSAMRSSVSNGSSNELN